MKSQRIREQFVELRASGLSYEKIARKLKISKQTLIEWGKQLEIQVRNLRAIELETLREKYAMSKKAKIKFYGERLRAIRKEFEGRDLKDLSSDRLFHLLQECSVALENETVGASVFAKEEPPGYLNPFRESVVTWEG